MYSSFPLPPRVTGRTPPVTGVRRSREKGKGTLSERFGQGLPHLISPIAERAPDRLSSPREGATAPGAPDSGPGRGVTGPGHPFLGGLSGRGVPSLANGALAGCTGSHLLGCTCSRPPAPGSSTWAAAPPRPRRALSAAILPAADAGGGRAEVPPAHFRAGFSPIGTTRPPSWKLAGLRPEPDGVGLCASALPGVQGRGRRTASHCF